MAAELILIPAVQDNVIGIIILIHQGVGVAGGDSGHRVRQLRHRPGIHLPAELKLGFHLVTLSNGYIAHVVRHTHHAQAAAFHNAHRGAHPGGDAPAHALIAPVPRDDLAGQAHAGNDVPVLAPAVGGLVFVHEVHVDVIIWNGFIKLGMQVHQRLGVGLKPLDPGLGGREGVHPCDDASAAVVLPRFLESAVDHLRRNQDGLVHKRERQVTGIIDFLDHRLGVLGYIAQAFLAVQVLGAHTKPKLILLVHGVSFLFNALDLSNSTIQVASQPLLFPCFLPLLGYHPARVPASA